MSSFAPIYGFYSKALHSRYSSVVERVIGNDEAESPILSSGTTFFMIFKFQSRKLKINYHLRIEN